MIAVLAVLVASAAMPASAHINLLQNPGFETGELAPWEVENGGLAAGYSHTGDYYAYANVDEDEGWVRQRIDPQCAEYLEFWYHGQIAGGGVLQFGIYYSDGTEYWEELSEADDWASVHENLDTTKLVEAVEVYVAAYLGAFGVDDFDLEACAVVGGVVIPTNTLAILSPWLAVIGLIGCIGAAVVVARKREVEIWQGNCPILASRSTSLKC